MTANNTTAPLSDDDLRVIMQDWDGSEPDQSVAIDLATELAQLRKLHARAATPDAGALVALEQIGARMANLCWNVASACKAGSGDFAFPEDYRKSADELRLAWDAAIKARRTAAHRLRALAGHAPAACDECAGTGERDSGGILPNGAPAMAACTTCSAPPTPASNPDDAAEEEAQAEPRPVAQALLRALNEYPAKNPQMTQAANVCAGVLKLAEQELSHDGK